MLCLKIFIILVINDNFVNGLINANLEIQGQRIKVLTNRTISKLKNIGDNFDIRESRILNPLFGSSSFICTVW